MRESLEHSRRTSEHRCKDKKKHRTYKKALKARDRRAQLFAVSLRVYLCQRCGFYHLTHEAPPGPL